MGFSTDPTQPVRLSTAVQSFDSYIMGKKLNPKKRILSLQGLPRCNRSTARVVHQPVSTNVATRNIRGQRDAEEPAVPKQPKPPRLLAEVPRSPVLLWGFALVISILGIPTLNCAKFSMRCFRWDEQFV